MRHRHRKKVALSVKLSSSRAVKTCGTLSSGTTVFCKISVRRSKNCLQLSIASGRLQIFRWPFPSQQNVETYRDAGNPFFSVICLPTTMEKVIFSMIGHGKIYLGATSEFQTTARTINSLETTSLACSVALFLFVLTESLPGRLHLSFSTKVLFPEACAYVL